MVLNCNIISLSIYNYYFCHSFCSRSKITSVAGCSPEYSGLAHHAGCVEVVTPKRDHLINKIDITYVINNKNIRSKIINIE